MKPMKCAPQKIYMMILGVLTLAGAAILFILGITLLPVLGILLSLPTFAVALYVFRLHLDDQCHIEPGKIGQIG